MAGFAVMSTSRLAMALIVFGTWGGMASVAKLVMEPVYREGLVALRTVSKKKRRLRLVKVVGTPWMYTTVFVVMLTAAAGVGARMLIKDTADFFGFQKHILSWEYGIHPKYVLLLCACALLSSGAAMVTFYKNTSGSSPGRAVTPDKYGEAWKVGAWVYAGVGVAGLLLFIAMEAAQSSPAAKPTMPGGASVAEAVATIVTLRSRMNRIPGDVAPFVRQALDGRLREMGLAGDSDRIQTFAHTLPGRIGSSAEVVERRMLARGFDADTAGAVKGEIRRARERMRDTDKQVRKVAIGSDDADMERFVASVVDGLEIGKDAKERLNEAQRPRGGDSSLRVLHFLSRPAA